MSASPCKDKDRTFEASIILATISVPLLAVVANTKALEGNLWVIRTLGVSGFLFLIAAGRGFVDLAGGRRFFVRFLNDLQRLHVMTLLQLLDWLLSRRGMILAGMAALFVFHVLQIKALFL